MRIFKKILPILLISIATIGFVSFLSPAQTAHAAATVECPKNSLLGFPTWYEYLKCDAQTKKPVFPGSVNDPAEEGHMHGALLVLMAAIAIVMRLAGVLAVVFIIIGGVKYTTSQGNPQDVEIAKNTIMYAVIGLVLTILASGIVSFIARSIN